MWWSLILSSLHLHKKYMELSCWTNPGRWRVVGAATALWVALQLRGLLVAAAAEQWRSLVLVGGRVHDRQLPAGERYVPRVRRRRGQ